MKPVFLSALIDDPISMFVCAKVYENLKAGVVEDSLLSVIMKHGDTKKLLIDNGL